MRSYVSDWGHFLERAAVVVRFLHAIPIPAYGFAFLHAWSMIDSKRSLALAAQLGAGFPGVLSIVIILTFAFLALRVQPERLRAASSAIACACLCVSPVVLGLAEQGFAPLPCYMTSNALALVGTLVAEMLWIDLYAQFNPIRAVYLYTASVVLAQVFAYYLELNPWSRVMSALMVLSLASYATYRLAVRRVFVNGVDAESGPATEYAAAHIQPAAMPWKMLTLIGVFSFAYGYVTCEKIGGMGYMSVIAALLIATVLLLDRREFNLSVVLRISLPLMLTGIMLALLWHGGVLGFPQAPLVFKAGFAALEVMLVMAACIVSYMTGASALWLYGIMRAAQFVCRHAGAASGLWLLSFDASRTGVVSDLSASSLANYSGILGETGLPVGSGYSYLIAGIVLLGAAVGASVLVVLEGNLLSSWGASLYSQGDVAESDMHGERVKARVLALSKNSKLTDREVEVVSLVVRGMTNAQVAEAMCIAEGTVKAHLSHIYQKCGIKSRRDLMMAVGEDPVRVRRRKADFGAD